MSLIVYPYIREEEDGKMIDLSDSISSPYNDLFGFESWRHQVWGSKTIEQLGCSLLTTLRGTDIYAEGVKIEKLEAELLRIKSAIKSRSIQLKIAEDSIIFRVENALEAIRVAKKHRNGGVYIG